MIYTPELFGAKGDNLTASAAQNVAAWNELFATVPNGSVIRPPTGAIYRVNDTLNFDNKQGVCIDSGVPVSAGVAPAFRWTGVGGKLMTVSEGFKNAIKGMTFDLVAGATIDKFIESDRLSAFNGAHLFKGLYLNAGLQANDNFVGIDIDPGGNDNNENFIIEEVTINGSSDFARPRNFASKDGTISSGSTTLTSASAAFVVGDAGKVIRVGKAGVGGITLVTTIAGFVSSTQVTLTAPNASGNNITDAFIHTGTGRGVGIRNGNNPNVKHNILSNIAIGYCNYGVHVVNGSVEIYNYGLGVCNTGLKIDAYTEAIIVEQMVTEGNLVEIDVVNGNGSLDVRDGRGSNLSQLTEGFFKVDGRIKFTCGQTETPPPPGGRIFKSLGTGNLRLGMDDFVFQNGPLSVSEAGFDTLANADRLIVPTSLQGVKGFPVGPFAFSPSDSTVNGYAASSSRPAMRDLVSVAGFNTGTSDPSNMGTAYPIQNDLYVGGGLKGFGGLHVPATPSVSVLGTAGAVTRRFRIIARDSLTRRVISIDPAGQHGVTTTCPTTLTATDFLRLSWPAQYPAPTDYQVVEQNPADITQGRVVATVSPSGTNMEGVDLTANPAGAFSAGVIPTRNETGTELSYAKAIDPVEITFTANDATPSVALGNDFLTANALATTITDWDDGTNGQQINNRIGDANTTIQNNAAIITGTGADIVCVNGAIYSFKRRGNIWRRLL